MEKRKEIAAQMILSIILIGLPLLILGYQFGIRPQLTDIRTIEIVAAIPEEGGFEPETIRIPAGERVRLRFSVSDVTHGIAIGPGLGIDLGNIDPGEVDEVEIKIDQPGRYTIYCNTWCSPNHWRMRATIEVYDPNHPEDLVIEESSDPIVETLTDLGVDIDAPHSIDEIPNQQPSAIRGQEIVAHLAGNLPIELLDHEFRQGQSPYAVWGTLKSVGLSDKEAWDAVAYLWLMDVDRVEVEKIASLYDKNCAACHGQNGDGQGPGANIIREQEFQPSDESDNPVTPSAFTDFESMLGGTSDIYYAKVRRGGMGSGMPGFGQIFTPEETKSLVKYLWTFVFGLPGGEIEE